MHYMVKSNASNVKCHKISLTSNGNAIHYIPKFSVMLALHGITMLIYACSL